MLTAQPVASGNTLLAVLRRPLVTCDDVGDLPVLQNAPQHVIFARGTAPQLGHHGASRAQRGSALVNFTAPTGGNGISLPGCAGAAAPEAALPRGTQSMVLRMDGQMVPAQETAYICKMFQLPGDKKYQVAGWDEVRIMHVRVRLDR